MKRKMKQKKKVFKSISESERSVKEFLEWFSQSLNEVAIYPSDMEEAVIGYVERFGEAPSLCLDYEICIQLLMRGGATRLEAEEYFQYNVLGYGSSDKTLPVFLIKKNG